MSPASFWDRSGLAPKQLPTLQELVRCCDEALLMRVILDDHVTRMEGAPLPSKRRRAMEKRLAGTLRSLCALPVKKKAGRGFLLVPEESFVLLGGSLVIERRLGASLVSLDDVRLLADPGEAPAGCDEGPARLRPSCGPLDEAPPRRAYALAPWEQALAYRAWLGGPWCRRERYLVIAGAVWEMTFFGFEYEQVVARQAQARGELLLAGQASGDEAACSPPPEDEAERARSFGLEEPDRFEADYRDSLAARTAELNRIARAEFRARCIDAARRIGAC